ncbi:MAG: Glutamine amidotransferase, cobB/cobQ-like protein [Candidatus Curtissbacteria bacterium GW2011_GWA1_40_9]|uniref:Lipid II isoglutaminyl synthase (glutamine-hydrolyzing) subunit GatD n=1 Tax=Candidatus Curtissbacteria bacterium GW2011_GWA1_40_9 TaxID=1618408 RepID=A0A0G0WSH6_9BACT|nr:MAG: Glutamine amidotransferase, cobB/cobQ-like protein [Candidatus Curtissbacteria bacterium GW2011_GWA1_40_9]
MKLNICHLYPDLMDTYGDRGNIISIVKRCKWRNISVTIKNLSTGDKHSAYDYDFYFFGGGQDKAQSKVAKDLQNKAKALKKAVAQGAVLLSICGGYQLLQNYFKTQDGEKIPGISLFDAYTEGTSTRMTGNLLIAINSNLQDEIKQTYQPLANNQYFTTNLIGFENHSGKTYLEKGVQPLGKVIKGAGNNGKDQTEGAVYNNAFGCYLHGSLLPKNPHFADYLISKALEKKYGKVNLSPLDDTIEWQAHKDAANRISSQA